MWIGFDWLGLPDPSADPLGVGRYARRLLGAFEAPPGTPRPIVYVPAGTPTPCGRSDYREVAPDPSPLSRRARSSRQRLVDENPDGLDWLVVFDPLAASPFGPPPDHGLSSTKKLAAFLPSWPEASDLLDSARRGLQRRSETLSRYDLLLTPSEALAEAVRGRLHLPADRVVALGPLCDRALYRRDPEAHAGRLTREFLCARGVRSSYILHEIVDGDGLRELVTAYAGLPVSVRLRYLLALSGPSDPLALAEELALESGVRDRLVTLAGLDPADRVRLLSAASLVAATGRGEHLPQGEVEALAMALPIVAVDTRGRREWLGDAASYAPSGRSEELSTRIARLLDAPEERAALALAGLDRAARIDEAAAAARLRDALAAATPRTGLSRVVEGLGLRPRPRLALFPAPAGGEGRGGGIAATLASLSGRLNVDLFVDPSGRLPDAPAPAAFGLFSAGEFARRDGVCPYDHAIHEIGESGDLDAAIERARSRPGLVVVRDGVWLPPPSFAALAPDRLRRSPALDPDAGARWAERLVLRILATGSHLAVASRWAADLALPHAGERADRVHLVPGPGLGAAAGVREATRERLKISSDELLVIHCGPASGDDPEMIRALAVRPDRLDARRGSAWDAATRPLRASARSEWLELAGAADLAIHPGSDPARPGRGLALLDLLRAGVPTIVPGRALPEGVAHALAGPADLDSFAAAVRALAGDPARRAAIGEAARLYAGGGPDTGDSPGRLLDALGAVAASRPDPREVRRAWRESARHEHAGPSRPAALSRADGRPR